MNESQEQFCQRLLAADPATPEFKAKYEREIHMLFVERKIEGIPKRKMMVQLTISLLTGTTFTVLAAIAGRSLFGPLALLLMLVSATFMFAMAGYLIFIMKRGKANLGTYNAPLEGLGWTLHLFIFYIFAFNSFFNPPGGLQLLGFGVGLLVFGGVGKIGKELKRAELRTREKLLRLEFQFAELTEKLQSKQD